MHRVRFRDPAETTRIGEWTAGVISFGGSVHDPEIVDVLPPCDPSKIVCVGLNYRRHAAEVGRELPDRPRLFFKPPHTLSGHGDTVTLPEGKEHVDYEAELGVVIGEQCRAFAEADAMDVVAGYTCMNDISNRDDQADEPTLVRSKAFDNAAPLGPVVATPDEVPDDARIQLRLNGETKQDSTWSDLIFTVPELIAEITRYMTLERGDAVSTGTPEGVGPLSDGDTVEVEIEGIGTLEHSVRRS